MFTKAQTTRKKNLSMTRLFLIHYFYKLETRLRVRLLDQRGWFFVPVYDLEIGAVLLNQSLKCLKKSKVDVCFASMRRRRKIGSSRWCHFKLEGFPTTFELRRRMNLKFEKSRNIRIPICVLIAGIYLQRGSNLLPLRHFSMYRLFTKQRCRICKHKGYFMSGYCGRFNHFLGVEFHY